MAITKTIENSGDKVVASGNGGVTVNQTSGEITIRSGAKVVARISEDGFQYYDSAGNERFLMGQNELGEQQLIAYDQNHTKRITLGQNTAGQQQIIVYDATGKAIALVGQDPKDGTPVIAVSESGEDVLESLQNG